MSGAMEITNNSQISSTPTLKIKNFWGIIDARSEEIEIFPGKMVAFVVKGLAPAYTEYRLQGAGDITITQNDKFFSLEVVAGEGVDPPRLAGIVEIILGFSSQSFSFGDHVNREYLDFDATNRSLVLKPGKIAGIWDFQQGEIGNWNKNLAKSLVHVELTAGGRDTLEIKFTLFTENQERLLLDSLKNSRYLSTQNAKIMKDESTADLKISCGEKENKKIFNVHKNFFFASSPVFRVAIESDMLEGRNSEIYIEEVDEKTVEEMISYIYTRGFTGADLNIQMVAWLANKYDLPGMMELLCSRIKVDKIVEFEKIADILIAAGKSKTPQNFF